MDLNDNEWELSKENVQPLRQGRRLSSLNAGLQPQGSDLSRIKQEKQAFEAEVRTYTGDDPLDVWYRYLKWAEQTFPKGGKDSNLTTINERCVALFKDEERYRNDERYIYAWIKMADACVDPLEIYSFLFDQNIGCELSCLYEAWAYILEQIGNTKKADAIYMEGLKRNARPLESLKSKHVEFQKRVMRNVVEGRTDDTSNSSPADERVALCRLKTSGKRNTVPVNRTGSAIQGNAGVLGGARPKTVQQIPGKGITVFNDENREPSNIPAQTGEWVTAPKRNVTNKENEKKAGVWTKQKISKPSVNVPISAMDKQKPAFSVHVDDNEQTMRTPAKVPEMSNQALSTRKGVEPRPTASYLKHIKEPQDPSEKPMYCKHKIYCGADEYSFEELRGICWTKKQEQKLREEEDERLMDECRQKLERERQLLLDEAEHVRQQRLQLQQEQHSKLEEARRQMQHDQEMFERETQLHMQKQRQILEQHIQTRMQEQLVSTSLPKPKPQGSARELTFDDGCHGNTENIPPQMASQLQSSRLQMSNSKQTTLPLPTLNASNRTPNSFMSNSQPQSSESFDRTMSGAPSPTVHTKEAMRLVMGMFNTSLALDKQHVEDVDMTEPTHDPSSPAPPGPAAGLPFVIYDETSIKKQKPTAPMTIFQDQENSRGKSNENRGLPREVAAEEQMEEEIKPGLFYDANMERIESHARDDITLAPIGSHLSFAESAKFASTPFNPNSSGSRMSNLDDSGDINMAELGGDAAPAPAMPDNEKPQTAVPDDSVSNLSGGTSDSFRKNLSPIMEGSSEDSSSHSKSSQLSTLHQSAIVKAIPLTPVLDQTENTTSLLMAAADGNQSMSHMIDTSAYFPPEMAEKTENLMSMSICIADPKNPFDKATIDKFLDNLKTPLMLYSNYNAVDECLADFRKGNAVCLGPTLYTIQGKIGEGGFARVFVAEDTDNDIYGGVTQADAGKVAIKVQQPASQWEFYICNEIQARLHRLKDVVDVRPAMMEVIEGYFFPDGSCLLTDYQPYGTLLDLANKCKPMNCDNRAQILEPVMCYMAIELMHIVEKLHKCQIIHGDIKPDNFLLLHFPRLPDSPDPNVVFGGKNRFAQLIDFGQSIDMSKYPSGTTFMADVQTQCFQCIEMKTQQPWTYQTDLFGLAGTIHVLLFNQYMKVYQEGGLWKMTSKFNRTWNEDLWKRLFHNILNIPSCDELPDLAALRRQFEEYFVASLLSKYNQQCGSLNKTVMSMVNSSLQ